CSKACQMEDETIRTRKTGGQWKLVSRMRLPCAGGDAFGKRTVKLVNRASTFITGVSNGVPSCESKTISILKVLFCCINNRATMSQSQKGMFVTHRARAPDAVDRKWSRTKAKPHLSSQE